MKKRIIPEELKVNNDMLPYKEAFSLICQNIEIADSDNKRFVYFIDEKYVMDSTRGYRYENITPAYDKILHSGLSELKYTEEKTEFENNYNSVCDSLILLSKRICEQLEKNNKSDRRIKWFEDIQNTQALHFEEAIQRMLFVNQIFWQTDHRLVGLGAWDSYLYTYYCGDIEDGIITKEDVLHILEDVFYILHENYNYKSNVLMGDTGQIFVLGKSNENGDYLFNDLTKLFIEAMKNVQQPDPKCLLRVNKNTPDEIFECALDSISTGLGAPLFANDDVIIPCLVKFGISHEDACDYTTSACWEPLIGGKSACNNNRKVLNYLKPLDNLLIRENLYEVDTFEKLIEVYLVYLKRYVKSIMRVLKTHAFQNNPLLSVFTYGCFESGKDVSQGGGKYGDLGITSVAIGNTVNSLYNIKKYVYDEEQLSLLDVKRMVVLDFSENENILEQLRNEPSVYGKDETDVIGLVQNIMNVVSSELKEYEVINGERIKIGLSGSAYMDAAREFGASFDGRKKGEPFIVHISNEENNGFTEIVNFASELDYSDSQFNGNVIDFMLSPSFVQNNKGKFILFLKNSVRRGFFEMQMNVVDSKTLIEARKNPEGFPDLIVRVWGFSAYFKDLPEEYKEVLIKRALENEKQSA